MATDIAARGIDIDQLPYVVNYELPNVPEDYVHRIGRTGRAEREGVAVSLVCVDEHNFMRNIEKLIKTNVEKVVVEGFEPDPSIRPEPIQLGRQNNGGGRGRSAKPGGNRARNSAPSSARKNSNGGRPNQKSRQRRA